MPPTTPNNAPSNNAPQNDKKVGPIIATLIIVLVLIIAALYLFAARADQPAIPDDATVSEYGLDGSTTPAEQTVKPVTSTSTDHAALQSDLNASTAGLDNQNF